MNGLIYDCEIKKCILSRGEVPNPGLEYCSGWRDFPGMGISVVACYDLKENAYRVFLDDNLSQFAELVANREHIIGFNSVSFDDPLCNAHGVSISTTYDILREVRAATGQPRDFTPGVTRSGYSLENIARTTLGIGKSGSGAMAPKLWQEGRLGEVIDYCLMDVQVTKAIFDHRREIKDPHSGSVITLGDPA